MLKGFEFVLGACHYSLYDIILESTTKAKEKRTIANISGAVRNQ